MINHMIHRVWPGMVRVKKAPQFFGQSNPAISKV